MIKIVVRLVYITNDCFMWNLYFTKVQIVVDDTIKQVLWKVDQPSQYKATKLVFTHLLS